VLSLSELVRIYVCLTPTDMRNYAVTVFMPSRVVFATVQACVGSPGNDWMMAMDSA